jgi:hypothetical protein
MAPRVSDRARGPRCECARCKSLESGTEKYISTTFSNYDKMDPNKTQGLSDHQALICMSHMFGFILKDRVYGWLISEFEAEEF